MIGIFLDLDGTLLNSNWELSKEDYEYLSSIKDKYNIYLITGSSYSGAIPYYKQLGLDTWFVTSQGQEISKPNKNIFNTNEIDKEKVKNFLDIEDNEYFIEATNAFYKTKGFNLMMRTNKSEVDNFDDLKRVTSIISKKKPASDLKLRSYVWDVDSHTRWHVIHNKASDKSISVKEIIMLDKLTKTYYFGDGRNDIKAMLEVDISVAMKNSYDIVKNKALHVTDYTNNESGVSRYLKKILK